MHALAQFFACLAGSDGGVLLYSYLYKLTGLKGVPCLLAQVVVDAVLADMENELGAPYGTQLCALFVVMYIFLRN